MKQLEAIVKEWSGDGEEGCRRQWERGLWEWMTEWLVPWLMGAWKVSGLSLSEVGSQ